MPGRSRPSPIRVVLLGLALLALLAACSPAGPPPAAPTAVTAVPGASSITVDWLDESEDETSFAVLRSQSGPPTQIATVPAGTTGYLDGTVNGDAPYTYWIEAVNAGGRSRSEPSNPVRPLVGGVPLDDPDDPVAVTLNQLGISTLGSARLNDRGLELPDDYLPFGPLVTLGVEDAAPRYELFIAGAATASGPSSNQVIWEMDEADAVKTIYGQGGPTFDLSALQADVYAFAAADVDGDGLDELVMVSLGGVGGVELTLSLLDDQSAGHARSDHALGSLPGAAGLALSAADLDGDGTDTLLVGVSGAGEAWLLFLADADAGFSVAETFAYSAVDPTAGTSLQVAAGNLDDDPREEFAVVVNETLSGPGSHTGSSRYYVYDDADAGLALLASGTPTQHDGSQLPALVADLALGDIDGDGRDEIVFGGLTEFHEACATYDLLYVALDDALGPEPLAVLGSKVRTVSMGGACNASKVKRLRFIHVELGDLDGDGVDEIVGGPMVFDDWRTPWRELGFIPADQMYGHGVQDAAAEITRANCALALVDMDGDGLSEVVQYMPRAEAVIRYTLPDTLGQALKPRTWFGVDFSRTDNGTRFRPSLVALNVDNDSLIARAVPQTRLYTMTRPIIVAALAGAPCYADLSQNLDACGTSFGTGSSTGYSREDTVTVSAGVTVGLKIIGGAVTQSEVAAKLSATEAAGRVVGFEYELEKSVVFATGPLEDAVVFTVIPYDSFTYVIVEHPDPTMVGVEAEVSLPRAPITMLVERSYFNSVQIPGSPLVDETIFPHAVGDPTTYRSVAERDAWLGLLGVQALSNGPVYVGQGSGATQVSIDVSTTDSEGSVHAVSYEFDLEATLATILLGFKVGVEIESALSFSHGTTTSFGAGVGNFADATDFATNGYAYGMFTYTLPQSGSGEQIKVIDFWVE